MLYKLIKKWRESSDCTTANKNEPWYSDSEIKIDKLGNVIRIELK